MQTSDGAVAVATSEAVALALDVAGLGHRALAWFADAAIIATFWFTVLFVFIALYFSLNVLIIRLRF